MLWMSVRRVATKDDLEVLRLEMRASHNELLAEIQRTARSMMLSFTTIVAVLNGIVFTALKLGA